MLSNYPPGVTESTYGAPWNEQLYWATFLFKFDTHINRIEFKTQPLEVCFTLNGPTRYSQGELHDAAVDAIKDEYYDFLLEFDYCEIVISNIEQE